MAPDLTTPAGASQGRSGPASTWIAGWPATDPVDAGPSVSAGRTEGMRRLTALTAAAALGVLGLTACDSVQRDRPDPTRSRSPRPWPAGWPPATSAACPSPRARPSRPRPTTTRSSTAWATSSRSSRPVRSRRPTARRARRHRHRDPVVDLADRRRRVALHHRGRPDAHRTTSGRWPGRGRSSSPTSATATSSTRPRSPGSVGRSSGPAGSSWSPTGRSSGSASTAPRSRPRRPAPPPAPWPSWSGSTSRRTSSRSRPPGTQAFVEAIVYRKEQVPPAVGRGYRRPSRAPGRSPTTCRSRRPASSPHRSSAPSAT